MSIVAQASNGHDAIQVFREHQPDVTLMDLRLPDMSGIDALIAIRSEFKDARIIILTTFSGDVEMQRALAAGARGYALKSMNPAELVQMIRQVDAGRRCIPPEVAEHLAQHMGEESLTAREIGILRLAAGGNGNREIAEKLLISEDTVKGHIRHIMEKLNAHDRTQAVSIALRRGIMHL
jgi:DNA-binding NarL/FixJ family response regulator